MIDELRLQFRDAVFRANASPRWRYERRSGILGEPTMRNLDGIAGAVLGCLAATTALGQTVINMDAVDVPKGSAAQLRASENAAVNLLYQRVESVEWTDATMEEVLDWLRDLSQGHVNIIVRWGPLAVENVSEESAVNLKLFNTRVADVLNEVLEFVSDGGGQLGFHAYGNSIRISTKQDFNRTLYMRVYDVTDLLFRIEDFGQEAPQIDLQQSKSSGGGGGGGGGQSVFQGAGGSRGQNQGGEQAEREQEERLEKLRTKIVELIAPETWQGTGGGLGRIGIVNRSLVVVNTIEVHEQLAGMFSFGG